MKHFGNLFIVLCLAVGVFFFSTASVKAEIQQLPLVYSATNLTAQVGSWDTWYYVPATQIPGQFNYVGLNGNVTMSYNAYNDATILFQIFLGTTGVCPPTGRYNNPSLPWPWKYIYPLQGGVTLGSYILRIAKPGTVTIPTNFTFPVKVPFIGCVGIMINGGELNFGDPVTTTSNLTLLYDTDPPTLPKSSINTFASEICIGRNSGCEKLAPYSSPDQAFARYQRFASAQILQAWNGDTNSASSRAGDLSLQCAPGAWSSTSDYYIYKSPDCPTTATTPVIYAGPSANLAAIPANAINLFSANIQGYQCNGDTALINKIFNPPVPIQAGDCMVQIQKFNTPSGLVTQETQSTFETSSGVTGYLDSVSCSQITGWAGIIGSVNPIDVHFYADGVGPDHFIGYTTANTTREKAVCDALGTNETGCNHGYILNFPDLLKDGQTHTIDAYAINNIDNPKLNGSGKTVTCPAGKTGDVNGDGSVNILDIGIVIDNYGKLPITYPAADINHDGVVNIIDIGLIIDNYGK